MNNTSVDKIEERITRLDAAISATKSVHRRDVIGTTRFMMRYLALCTAKTRAEAVGLRRLARLVELTRQPYSE